MENELVYIILRNDFLLGRQNLSKNLCSTLILLIIKIYVTIYVGWYKMEVISNIFMYDTSKPH